MLDYASLIRPTGWRSFMSRLRSFYENWPLNTKDMERFFQRVGEFHAAWSQVESEIRALMLLKNQFDSGKTLEETYEPNYDGFMRRVRKLNLGKDNEAFIEKIARLRNFLIHGVFVGINRKPAILHQDVRSTISAQGFKETTRAFSDATRAGDSYLNEDSLIQLTEDSLELANGLAKMAQEIRNRRPQ